jgi:hypothetical protein
LLLDSTAAIVCACFSVQAKELRLEPRQGKPMPQSCRVVLPMRLVLSGLVWLLSISGALAADCLVNTPYDASTTCAVPAGATQITVQAWGGGGSGNYFSGGSGSGGGGGAFCGATVPVTSGTTLTLTVGPGGLAYICCTGGGDTCYRHGRFGDYGRRRRGATSQLPQLLVKRPQSHAPRAAAMPVEMRFGVRWRRRWAGRLGFRIKSEASSSGLRGLRQHRRARPRPGGHGDPRCPKELTDSERRRRCRHPGALAGSESRRRRCDGRSFSFLQLHADGLQIVQPDNYSVCARHS